MDEARPGGTPSEKRYRLLVPVLEGSETDDVERLIGTAAILAREREGTLVVLYLATLARSMPLDAVSPSDPVSIEAREELADLLDNATGTGSASRGDRLLDARRDTIDPQRYRRAGV